MPFTDNLAFEMVTLVLAAATIAYTAFIGLVEYRRRGPDGLRNSLRGAAAPVGLVGGVAVALGLWGDLTWPLPGAYNILFGDVYMLFGIVMVGFAVSILLHAKLQFLGMFSLVAGAAVLEYGYQAYQLGLTKEPFEMFGLYAAFGVAAMLAFPATLVADRMLLHPSWTPGSTRSALANAMGTGGVRLGRRASQPIAPGVGAAASTEPTEEPASAAASPSPFRIPSYATALVLVFFVFSVVAAIAAIIFVGNTVPSHLASPP